MIGREIDRETEAKRRGMCDMTGVDVSGCPWRAFTIPIVREVLHALRFFESGNLALALPDPSHRLMEGIGFWQQVYNRVQSKQLELERKEREAKSAADAAAAKVRR
jgi:hypothetical protein